jgi:hypothetical protein
MVITGTGEISPAQVFTVALSTTELMKTDHFTKPLRGGYKYVDANSCTCAGMPARKRGKYAWITKQLSAIGKCE